MTSIQWFFRSANKALGFLCTAMLAATVLLTVLQVVFRYVLDDPLSWSEELARWLFVWCVYLGCAVLIGMKRHMRMEFVVSRVSAVNQQRLEVAAFKA